MAVNLFSLFGGNRSAAEAALRSSEQQRMRQAANNVAAATARSGVNPAAAARLHNQATVEERNASAANRAQMLAQAQRSDQEGVSQLIGGGLGIVGQALGGMIGGPVGAPLGGMAGQAVGGLVAPKTQAPQQPRPAQPPSNFSQPASGMGRALGSPGPGFAGQTPYRTGMAMDLDNPAGYGPPRDPGAPNPAVASSVNSLSRGQFDPTDVLGMMVSGVRSDEESKTAIQDASRAIDQFLGAIDPQSFRYRDPSQPDTRPGQQTGVMAQDLERSAVGRQMVQQGPDGVRRIDPQAALSALLASQARLNDRLQSLEGGHPERRPVREHTLDLRQPGVRDRTVDMRPARPPAPRPAQAVGQAQRDVNPRTLPPRPPAQPSGSAQGGIANGIVYSQHPVPNDPRLPRPGEPLTRLVPPPGQRLVHTPDPGVLRMQPGPPAVIDRLGDALRSIHPSIGRAARRVF